MNIDEQIRALHEAAVVQGVNIESLHSSCNVLHESVAELRADITEMRIGMTEMRGSIERQGENIDSLGESARTLLESLTKLALISQSHHQRISALEEAGSAHQ